MDLFDFLDWMVIITVVGGIWAFSRLIRYSYGSHSNEIYVPLTTWLAVLFGIWWPVFNIFVLLYVFFACKSVPRLVATRRRLIKCISPEDVVEIVDATILDQDLAYDDWVLNVWKRTTSEGWVTKLTSNESTLRKVLEYKMEVHASKLTPHADWVEVVKAFNYLCDRDSAHVTSGTTTAEDARSVSAENDTAATARREESSQAKSFTSGPRAIGQNGKHGATVAGAISCAIVVLIVWWLFSGMFPYMRYLFMLVLGYGAFNAARAIYNIVTSQGGAGHSGEPE